MHSAKVDGSLSDLFAAQDQIVSALATWLAPSPDRAPGSGVHPAPVLPVSDARPAAPDETVAPADVTGRLVVPTDEAEGLPSTAAPGRRRVGGFAVTGRPDGDRGPNVTAARNRWPVG